MKNRGLTRCSQHFPLHIAGFPTGTENMGGALQNLMGGLESIHGGSMGGRLKRCREIPVKEFIC